MKIFTKDECEAMAQRAVDEYWDSELGDIDESYEEPEANPFTVGTEQFIWFDEAYKNAMNKAMEIN